MPRNRNIFMSRKNGDRGTLPASRPNFHRTKYSPSLYAAIRKALKSKNSHLAIHDLQQDSIL
jgi:hypothetical protein